MTHKNAAAEVYCDPRILRRRVFLLLPLRLVHAHTADQALAPARFVRWIAVLVLIALSVLRGLAVLAFAGILESSQVQVHLTGQHYLGGLRARA